MPRNVKIYAERRNELIEVAKKLFLLHGYENTSVNAIIREVGVAKGTFYHYFKSKDAIVDAVIEESIKNSRKLFIDIRDQCDLNPLEKLLKITRSFLKQAKIYFNQGILLYLKSNNNLIFHQKMKIRMIEEYVPIISSIVKEGVEEGIFQTEFSDEITRFLLVGFHFMLDSNQISLSDKPFVYNLDAVSEIYEKVLGAPKGSFFPIIEDFKKLMS
ncbi:TetR/AcrR family transcriptional regulator [Bacillus sp. FJAT-26377]|nr:TetR/AcrR family transcriptional regulator [Bacillus sp. FJAT-26377]